MARAKNKPIWSVACFMKIATSILAPILTCLVACGAGLVRGEAPLVSVSALQLESQQLHVRLNLHNPNDVSMEVDRIELSMQIGEAELGRQDARPGLSIHPNGTEEVSFNLPASDAAGRNLTQLQNGAINSVQYTVKGQVFDKAGKSEKFSQQGYFYPVPGRPGQFRGAAPQREPVGG